MSLQLFRCFYAHCRRTSSSIAVIKEAQYWFRIIWATGEKFCVPSKLCRFLWTCCTARKELTLAKQPQGGAEGLKNFTNTCRSCCSNNMHECSLSSLRDIQDSWTPSYNKQGTKKCGSLSCCTDEYTLPNFALSFELHREERSGLSRALVPGSRSPGWWEPLPRLLSLGTSMSASADNEKWFLVWLQGQSTNGK